MSVIIVNYNVRYFLEQCLCSLQAALDGIAAETIVVDNGSTDDSITYLSSRFPGIKFIQNTKNEGFAKANNQALHLARGEYILFLNPDTILAEDTLQQCIAFFASHPNAGVVGVRMMDGSGNFLPESKRAFPSPKVSFFKLAGLSSLFPTSRLFNRYALGYLPERATHEVDVIAGAFMMTKKSVLDKVGSFDEQFFMYAEDVDLSYRIQAAGYKNYYLGNVPIVHFKGESTKRGSLHYVHMFYKAMQLFVKKHYRSSGTSFFAGVLNAGILARQFVAALSLPLHKKQDSVQHIPRRVYVVGNESHTTVAHCIISQHFPQVQVTDKPNLPQGAAFNKSDLVVFCTGENLPAKKALQWIDAHAKAAQYAWCIKGSRSIVGSSNKDAAGNFWT